MDSCVESNGILFIFYIKLLWGKLENFSLLFENLWKKFEFSWVQRYYGFQFMKRFGITLENNYLNKFEDYTCYYFGIKKVVIKLVDIMGLISFMRLELHRELFFVGIYYFFFFRFPSGEYLYEECQEWFCYKHLQEIFIQVCTHKRCAWWTCLSIIIMSWN